MSRLTLSIELQGDLPKLLDCLGSIKETVKTLGLSAEVTLKGQLDVNESVRLNPVDLNQHVGAVFTGEALERPRNCLLRARINTLGDLVQRSGSDLLAITNFGQKSLDQVNERLSSLGLSLSDTHFRPPIG